MGPLHQNQPKALPKNEDEEALPKPTKPEFFSFGLGTYSLK